jgi:hypothetical protein
MNDAIEIFHAVVVSSYGDGTVRIEILSEVLIEDG